MTLLVTAASWLSTMLSARCLAVTQVAGVLRLEVTAPMPKEFGTVGPRSIYPEMCDSRSLARCGLMANALFPRLIVQADDQGRLHGDGVDMAGLCFSKMPKLHRQVPAALEELAAQKCIIAYEVDGEPYIQITEWWQYQGHQRRAYPSRHPAPEGWEDKVYGLTRQVPADSGETPPDAPRNSGTRGESPPSLAEPSPSLSSPSVPSPREPSKKNGLTPVGETLVEFPPFGTRKAG